MSKRRDSEVLQFLSDGEWHTIKQVEKALGLTHSGAYQILRRLSSKLETQDEVIYVPVKVRKYRLKGSG